MEGQELVDFSEVLNEIIQFNNTYLAPDDPIEGIENLPSEIVNEELLFLGWLLG